jgi:hypothetical protein
MFKIEVTDEPVWCESSDSFLGQAMILGCPHHVELLPVVTPQEYLDDEEGAFRQEIASGPDPRWDALVEGFLSEAAFQTITYQGKECVCVITPHNS